MAKRFFGKPFMNWYRKLLRNSRYRWVVLLGTLVYLVSPIDIAPDAIPILGWLDDGLIATIAITEISQILLDRKRNLRQAQEPITTASAVDTGETVIDIDAVAVS
ncbi:YkvA family protein [Nodosilinea sp. PGN35]|uniref:YkvA family protein n=1 Tax=Nodosilinea sp. PGN35 TaxID=3020489 RepID=UPI0023B31E33|nr:YkvA family protein [Nodosilinea sp. TSF1-S3]MDF0368461.1 YkvA family protein [Nodosilinea sp. TSF1-S3]